MSRRLRGEKPLVLGKASCRSAESPSITDSPHPSNCCLNVGEDSVQRFKGSKVQRSDSDGLAEQVRSKVQRSNCSVPFQ